MSHTPPPNQLTMADDYPQANLYNNYEFSPKLDSEHNFHYPPVPQSEHLAPSPYPQAPSHHVDDGVLYGTSIGDGHVLGHQALGNGTSALYDYPFNDGYTYPCTVSPDGNQDLNTTPSEKHLEAPIQSIEHPTNHGQFTNLKQAAADTQSYEETALTDPEGRSRSRNSQVLQSATPEPLFNKSERKKRKSSSAAPSAANERQRTPRNATNINSNEDIVGEKTGVRGKPKGGKSKLKQQAPIRTPDLNTTTSNNTQEKRKLDAAPPSTNKRRRKSDDKTPDHQLQDGIDNGPKDSASPSVVFVSPDQRLVGQYDQAAMTAKAREVGVHSTVALFRPPTEASKKYSSKSFYCFNERCPCPTLAVLILTLRRAAHVRTIRETSSHA